MLGIASDIGGQNANPLEKGGSFGRRIPTTRYIMSAPPGPKQYSPVCRPCALRQNSHLSGAIYSAHHSAQARDDEATQVDGRD